MAKKIKVIQCPQCGSARQSEIKQDHYKCDSCGTEYFLDNDDINVNINHNVNNKGSAVNPKYIILGIGIVFAFVILIPIMALLRPKPTVNRKEIQKEYKDIAIYSRMFAQDGSPILFYVCNRLYDYRDKERFSSDRPVFAVFYDYMQNKVVNDVEINNMKDIYRSKSIYVPSIDKHLLIIDDHKIIELDFENFTLTDITASLLADFPEFSSGVSSVKLIDDKFAEGFVLISNMAKEFYFIPCLKKLYTKDHFFEKAYSEKKGLSTDAKERTYHIFTKKSSDFPDELIQLLEIKYMYNNGEPESKTNNIYWRKDYGRSGIFYTNEQTPYRKILIDTSGSRTKSWKDITPGRIYFNPWILYPGDGNDLLIAYKPTVASTAQTMIQLLDLSNQEPLWTLGIDERIENVGVIKTDTHFIMMLDSEEILRINITDGTSERIKFVTTRAYE